MTKRRSSISGRGAEILLGEPPPVEIEPRGPEEAAAAEAEGPEPEPVAGPPADVEGEPAPPLPEPEPALDDAELERLLFEEAQAGEASPEGEEDLSALDAEPPPTPEMELALFEEAVGAEEPPEPVVEAPPPTSEVTMEEQERYEEAAMHEPPPPETSDVAEDILPSRPEPAYFGMEDMEAVLSDIQEQEEEVERLELPERELTEEEQKELLERLGSARIQALDEEISKTYDLVLSKVGENENIATDCYNLLLKSRDIVLRRDAARIPQAEYYVEQVLARLKRATDSESSAKKYAWWIFGWGALWGIVFMAVLILLNYDWFSNAVTPTSSLATLEMDVFLQAMIWGGIGGVAAVWYSLFKHVGRRDFDSQYNLSYSGKPFLGLVLGATVYMIFNLVIRTLGILPVGTQGSGQVAAPTVAPGVIYLMSWACGFKENRIFDLVDRVMKRVFSGEEAKQPEPPVEPAEPAR